MGRPLGAVNISESQRQKAVRLLASGLTKDQVKQELVNSGSKESSARQYVFFAVKQLTKELSIDRPSSNQFQEVGIR